MRQLLWTLLLAVLVMATVSAAAVIWRTELAETAMRTWLAQNGFPEARLHVESVGPRRIAVTRLDLGPDAPRIDRLTVEYALSELYGGRVRAVDISGLSVSVDPTAERPLPWLDALMARRTAPPPEATARAAPADLPRVTLRDARIDVLGAPDPIAVHLAGDLRPGDDDGAATLKGRAEADHTRLDFAAEVTGLLSRPHLRANAEGRTALAELPWPASWASVPTNGDVRFETGYNGPLPDAGDGVHLPDAAEASLRLYGENVALPPYLEGGAANAALRVTTKDGSLLVHLDEALDARAARLDDTALAERLLDPRAAILAGRLRHVSLAAYEREAPIFALRPSDDGWEWRAQPVFGAELEEGRIELTADAGGTLGRDLDPRRALAEIAREGMTEAALTLRAEAIPLPPFVDGIEVDAALRARLADEALRVYLQEPLDFRARRVHAEALGELLPIDPRALALVDDLRGATLEAVDPGSPLLALRPIDGGWDWRAAPVMNADLGEGRVMLRAEAEGRTGPGFAPRRTSARDLRVEAAGLAFGDDRLTHLSFDGQMDHGANDANPGSISADGVLDLRVARLHVAETELSDLRLRAPLSTRHDPTVGETFIELTREGELRLSALPDTPPLSLSTPSRVVLSEGRLTMREEGLGGRIAFDPGELGGMVEREGEPPVAVIARPGTIDVSFEMIDDLVAEARLRGAALALPSEEFEAGGIDLDLAYSGQDAVRANLLVGEFRHVAPDPLFAPLRVEVSARLDGTYLMLSGEAGPRGRSFGVPLRAEHDLETNAGGLRFGPATASFGPNDLRPEDLTPLLRDIGATSGRVTAEGRLAWTADEITSRGALRFDAVAAEAEGMRVEGLSGALNLSSLLPLRTPPGQRLSVDRLTTGVTLRDLRTSFQFDGGPSDYLIVRVEEAGGHLAGGRISLTDETIYPGADVNSLTLRVDALSLRELLEMLNVEGIRGDGRLSGRVPISFGEDGLVIRRGTLGAQESGRLHVSLGAYGRTLAAQGEQVALMMQALEDFHYDVLDLALDRAADGQTTLEVQMEGHNPEVYDAYPFRFNISLSGNTDPLMAALFEGQRLSTELLQRSLDAE